MGLISELARRGTLSPGRPYRDSQSLQRSLIGPLASFPLVVVCISSAVVVCIGLHVGGDSGALSLHVGGDGSGSGSGSGRLHSSRLRAGNGSLRATARSLVPGRAGGDLCANHSLSF